MSARNNCCHHGPCCFYYRKITIAYEGCMSGKLSCVNSQPFVIWANLFPCITALITPEYKHKISCVSLALIIDYWRTTFYGHRMWGISSKWQYWHFEFSVHNWFRQPCVTVLPSSPVNQCSFVNVVTRVHQLHCLHGAMSTYLRSQNHFACI